MTQEKGIFFSALVSSPASLQAARALAEAGLLGAYYTPGAFKPHGAVVNVARRVDGLLGSNLTAQVMRRCAEGVPDHLVQGFSWTETARTVLFRIGVPQRRLAGLTRSRLNRFERKAAQAGAAYPVIYTDRGSALESLSRAKAEGRYSIYSVGGLGLDVFRSVERAEAAKFPHLDIEPETSTPEWLDRYEKCSEEIKLADLAIFNSRLTLESHGEVAAQKGRFVPLGFPEVCPEICKDGDFARGGEDRPLRILWAGNFSIMKGAHYFLQALDRLAREGVAAEVRIYGKQLLPSRIWAQVDVRPPVRPTIPRAELMEEYRRADILVLPTLSDGFGMVISEAMSQGLPVLTTVRAGASEFIRHGENGYLVPPADSAALAERLAWCADHRDALRQAGVRARETAAAWQWSDYRKALAAIVVEALKKRPAA